MCWGVIDIPWFKIDDTLHSHPKARGCGLPAMGLWSLAGAYSMAYRLDGYVPADYVRTWPGGARLAESLVNGELWHRSDAECDCLPDERKHGWYFHDWADYQMTADEIERDREHARQRQRRRRENLRTMRENALAAKEGDADDAA